MAKILFFLSLSLEFSINFICIFFADAAAAVDGGGLFKFIDCLAEWSFTIVRLLHTNTPPNIDRNDDVCSHTYIVVLRIPLTT